METFATVRELGVKYNAGTEITLSKEKTLNSSRLMNEAFRKLFDGDTLDYKESFHVIYLDTSLKPIAHAKVGEGGLNFVAVDVRIVFSQALLVGATNIVLCHNHPSNSMTASDADKQITKKFVEAGKVLDIKVLDHLIICPNGNYLSFTDEYLMPN